MLAVASAGAFPLFATGTAESELRDALSHEMQAVLELCADVSADYSSQPPLYKRPNRPNGPLFENNLQP